MKVVDIRENTTDANKVIFGSEGEYITDNFNVVDDEFIAICHEEDGEGSHFFISFRDIDILIKALQIAKEWD